MIKTECIRTCFDGELYKPGHIKLFEKEEDISEHFRIIEKPKPKKATKAKPEVTKAEFPDM